MTPRSAALDKLQNELRTQKLRAQQIEFSKLPDGGERIRARIQALEQEIAALSLPPIIPVPPASGDPSPPSQSNNEKANQEISPEKASSAVRYTGVIQEFF